MVIKVKGHQNLTNSWGIITQIHTKLHTSVSDQQFFSYCTDTWTPIQIDVAKTILALLASRVIIIIIYIFQMTVVFSAWPRR